jgi:hypothetical protein
VCWCRSADGGELMFAMIPRAGFDLINPGRFCLIADNQGCLT